MFAMPIKMLSSFFCHYSFSFISHFLFISFLLSIIYFLFKRWLLLIWSMSNAHWACFLSKNRKKTKWSYFKNIQTWDNSDIIDLWMRDDDEARTRYKPPWHSISKHTGKRFQLNSVTNLSQPRNELKMKVMSFLHSRKVFNFIGANCLHLSSMNMAIFYIS